MRKQRTVSEAAKQYIAERADKANVFFEYGTVCALFTAQEAAFIAEEEIKERAISAFCETYSKDCVQCKLAKQIDFGCRETCPAYEQFMELLNK
jgi:hypothetical protein